MASTAILIPEIHMQGGKRRSVPFRKNDALRMTSSCDSQSDVLACPESLTPRLFFGASCSHLATAVRKPPAWRTCDAARLYRLLYEIWYRIPRASRLVNAFLRGREGFTPPGARGMASKSASSPPLSASSGQWAASHSSSCRPDGRACALAGRQKRASPPRRPLAALTQRADQARSSRPVGRGDLTCR